VSEPRKAPSIEPAGIFDGIRPGAIVLGVIVDTVATIVSGVALLFAFTIQAALQHQGDVPDEVLDAMVTSPTFLLASLVVGLLCTTLGAYVGARRAAIPGQGEPNPFWFDIVAFALIIPAGVAGGLLARHWPLERAA
jgi:hypothetical protein